MSALDERGFDFFTGVPCSSLAALMNRVRSFLVATNEGEAVALAAGSWLAGRRPVVMLQNSGLGNAVNPLTSLAVPFRIPLLLIVSWRGEPGLEDEPQHRLMGAILPDLLPMLSVDTRVMPDDPRAMEAALDSALASMNGRALPSALIARQHALVEEAASAAAAPPSWNNRGTVRDLRGHGAPPSRYDVLERVVAGLDDATAIVSTTGKCSRELYTIADRPQHFYQVGSMGFAAAIAAGVAMHTSRAVVALDGDGAALMHLGNMATIGARAPRGLTQVLLDNGVHDSTGGQPTISPSIDFAGVAQACGYRTAWRCDDVAGFAEALAATRGEAGPHLIHVAIRPGSRSPLPRPKIAPDEVARRFRAFVTGP